MLIRVVYKGDVHDYVKDHQLGKLLDAGKIIRFLRRSGWVEVGIDPIRTDNNTAYSGVERRNGLRHNQQNRRV